MGYREDEDWRELVGVVFGRGRGGGWELDEKKHWCVDCAALLFSLMFPLLSAVGAVSGNHARGEELQRR